MINSTAGHRETNARQVLSLIEQYNDMAQVAPSII